MKTAQRNISSKSVDFESHRMIKTMLLKPYLHSPHPHTTCIQCSKKKTKKVSLLPFNLNVNHPKQTILISNQASSKDKDNNPIFNKAKFLGVIEPKKLSLHDQETSFKRKLQKFSCPLPSASFLAHCPNQEMGVVASQDDVLTLVHPGPRLELFRHPIRAGELMKKYPKHCIARPDVFEFPWIALHPQAILPRGCVFFLVPYYTINVLLKNNRLQQQQEQQQQQKYMVPSKHKTSLHCLNNCNRRSDHQESRDGGNLYRFIGRLMKRNMNQREESSYYQPDSLVYSSRRPRVNSGEMSELLRIKPCMRQPESDRKRLNLKVTFYDFEHSERISM